MQRRARPVESDEKTQKTAQLHLGCAFQNRRKPVSEILHGSCLRKCASLESRVGLVPVRQESLALRPNLQEIGIQGASIRLMTAWIRLQLNEETQNICECSPTDSRFLLNSAAAATSRGYFSDLVDVDGGEEGTKRGCSTQNEPGRKSSAKVGNPVCGAPSCFEISCWPALKYPQLVQAAAWHLRQLRLV